MAVMRRDDIVVGDKTSIGKSPPAIVENQNAPGGASGQRTDEPSAPKLDQPSICGEMSQQRGHRSAQSTPQKFLQLVGCREPHAKR
jgi:hypothetical protein